MRFGFIFWVTMFFLLALGVWLDRQSFLAQMPLFIAFQVASLSGVVLAILYLWPKLGGTFRRILLVGMAFVVWRISYFPIMVFAGWITTLGDWLIIQTQWLPTMIYPSFLVVMALMNLGIIVVGALVVHRRRYAVLPVLGLAAIIAVMVSFTDRTDLQVLPDRSYALSEALPDFQPSLGNPYYEAVDEQQYNVAEYVLVFASALMFSAIPSTPWSTEVKSVLEHQFRRMPRASSERRVIEHYLAFRGAQKWITCRGECRDNWSNLLSEEARHLSAAH